MSFRNINQRGKGILAHQLESLKVQFTSLATSMYPQSNSFSESAPSGSTGFSITFVSGVSKQSE